MLSYMPYFVYGCELSGLKSKVQTMLKAEDVLLIEFFISVTKTTKSINTHGIYYIKK